MDPVTGAAAAQGAASAMAAAASFVGGERTNAQNKDIWRKTQDWQEYMSNTAYQRSVADMKKAGLNPMLMVSKGFTPAGAPSGNTGAPMQNNMASAAQAALLASQIELNRAQTAKTTVEAANVGSETPLRTAIGKATAKAIDTAESFGSKLPKIIGGWLFKADQAIRGLPQSAAAGINSARLASMSFKDMKKAGLVK